MTYRFHQLLNATGNPHKALAESTPSAAMLGGIFCEGIAAERLGFTPWLPDGIEITDTERELYDVPVNRILTALSEYHVLSYQPELFYPSIENPLACGHPDFAVLEDDHIIDLKTTTYPTEEMLDKLLHSIQMVAYMHAYIQNYGRSPKLTIVYASRMAEPDPVSFNKNGSVSLSGQSADYESLKEAVTLMDNADERHWAMVYKAPVWNPIMMKTIEREECEQLARVGEIFLRAGLEILESGLAEIVVRPYT